MRKFTWKALKIAACVLCMLSVSGCWNSRELNTLSIVMGVGIDKAEEAGEVRITAQVVRPGEIGSAQNGGQSSTGGDAFWNVKNTGLTVFSTIRDMTNQISRKLFFSHNRIIIFGKSLAEEGVHGEVDFFARDPEPRSNVYVLVAEGTAEEVLDTEAKLEKIPADKIADMVEGQTAAMSQSCKIKLSDFVLRLMSKTTAPIATMIEVTGEGEEAVPTICGTAVFKQDKLVGKLDKREGRGLLWVLGEVELSIIVVDGPDGSPVSLESIRSSGKITPELRDGKVVMKIKITEEGNVAEDTGTTPLNTTDALAFLEQQKTEAIRSEILAAFEKAKELDADIFGFGEALYQKYPNEWKDMEDQWDEIFPTIELELDIDAQLRLTGRINSPVTADEG
ncbi:MAG TPA: Ger(x)C family spore germination protein [Oscillospiraceae bacterium]|nr:Ger(x)C family spore germination protein [Oscillospiraceae bacterium]